MAKFRKKPIVIEAEQFIWKKSHPLLSSSEPSKIPNGVIKKVFTDYQDPKPYYKYGVETLEGFMECKDGDWIIKGIKGEFYPCKPDIFEQTYEKVIPANVMEAKAFIVDCEKDMGFMGSPKYDEMKKIIKDYEGKH